MFLFQKNYYRNLSFLKYSTSTMNFMVRQDIANWVYVKMKNDANCLSNVLWTKKTHFSVPWSVDTHNCCIHAKENPHALIEKSLRDLKVIEWYSFTTSFIIGLFIFKEISNGRLQIVSVTGGRYAALLRNRIVP